MFFLHPSKNQVFTFFSRSTEQNKLKTISHTLIVAIDKDNLCIKFQREINPATMDIKFILTWFSCHYYQLFQNFNVIFFVVFKQVLTFWPFSNSQCTNEVIKRSWIHLSMCELTYNQLICNKTPYILNLEQSNTYYPL